MYIHMIYLYKRKVLRVLDVQEKLPAIVIKPCVGIYI